MTLEDNVQRTRLRVLQRAEELGNIESPIQSKRNAPTRRFRSRSSA